MQKKKDEKEKEEEELSDAVQSRQWFLLCLFGTGRNSQGTSFGPPGRQGEIRSTNRGGAIQGTRTTSPYIVCECKFVVISSGGYRRSMQQHAGPGPPVSIIIPKNYRHQDCQPAIPVQRMCSARKSGSCGRCTQGWWRWFWWIDSWLQQTAAGQLHAVWGPCSCSCMQLIQRPTISTRGTGVSVT